MAKLQNGVETLPKILIPRVGRTNVTDDRRQTDGRTNVNVSSRSLEIANITLGLNVRAHCAYTSLKFLKIEKNDIGSLSTMFQIQTCGPQKRGSRYLAVNIEINKKFSYRPDGARLIVS